MKEFKNESGLTPVEYKILVRPLDVAEKTESGLLFKPETIREREQAAQTQAVFVAAGCLAFTTEGRQWSVYPMPGDYIAIDRYCGSEVKGLDGVTYKLCNDQDVTAIIDKGVCGV